MVNKNIIVTLFVTAAAAVPQTGAAQKAAYNTPGAGNPILPGYFADPTIKKFGDTYYIYATTDGSGAGFGPAQLWCTTLREPATLSYLVILPTQPSRSLVTPIIYMLLPMVAEPVSDRHSSGAARISRTGP